MGHVWGGGRLLMKDADVLIFLYRVIYTPELQLRRYHGKWFQTRLRFGTWIARLGQSGKLLLLQLSGTSFGCFTGVRKAIWNGSKWFCQTAQALPECHSVRGAQ